MLLYIIYNADLIDIPTNIASEDALGYVDDIAIITIGSDFTKTTNRIKNIMTKPEGGLNWSKAHNSKFKVNKLAIMHLSRKSVQDPDNNNERIQTLFSKDKPSRKYRSTNINRQPTQMERTGPTGHS